MKTIFCFITLFCVALLSIPCSAHKPDSTLRDSVNESGILFQPEQKPYYLRGGNQGLLDDLYTAILKTMPVRPDSVSGRAFVSFKITKQGMIDQNSIKVIRNRSVPDDYMNAAIEAIKSLGKFEPGKLSGTPVNVTYTISVIYPVPAEFIKTSE